MKEKIKKNLTNLCQCCLSKTFLFNIVVDVIIDTASSSRWFPRSTARLGRWGWRTSISSRWRRWLSVTGWRCFLLGLRSPWWRRRWAYRRRGSPAQWLPLLPAGAACLPSRSSCLLWRWMRASFALIPQSAAHRPLAASTSMMMLLQPWRWWQLLRCWRMSLFCCCFLPTTLQFPLNSVFVQLDQYREGFWDLKASRLVELFPILIIMAEERPVLSSSVQSYNRIE